MKKKLSMNDIAKHFQVSSATISLVLNGKSEENKIRPELVKKIKSYVKEVGYRPNLLAKSLRTGKTRIIGMLVEGISDPFFSSIAKKVETEAYKQGYKLFYSSSDNDPKKAKALLRAFRERHVEAYIIAPTPDLEDEIQDLLDDKFPVIVFDRYMPGVNTVNVVIDNYKGSLEAVQHLIKNRFKNIGFVTLDSTQIQMADREKGYIDGIASISSKPVIQKIPYSLSYDENINSIKSFIEKNPLLDAIFFATNYLTISGLKAIKTLNLSIPEDLAVISFDDNSHFELFSPTISAVAQPIEEISNEIIKQLNIGLADAASSIQFGTTVLSPRLIARESTNSKVIINRNQKNQPLNIKTK